MVGHRRSRLRRWARRRHAEQPRAGVIRRRDRRGGRRWIRPEIHAVTRRGVDAQVRSGGQRGRAQGLMQRRRREHRRLLRRGHRDGHFMGNLQRRQGILQRGEIDGGGHRPTALPLVTPSTGVQMRTELTLQVAGHVWVRNVIRLRGRSMQTWRDGRGGGHGQDRVAHEAVTVAERVERDELG